jgi:hypothetical protein
MKASLRIYYLPAALEPREYPNLIKQGARVSTIAVPTVLVAFNWPAKTNRYQRLERFVRLLVFPNRQAAGVGLRPETEVGQSRCDCSRTYPLLCSAGLAGS